MVQITLSKIERLERQRFKTRVSFVFAAPKCTIVHTGESHFSLFPGGGGEAVKISLPFSGNPGLQIKKEGRLTVQHPHPI